MSNVVALNPDAPKPLDEKGVNRELVDKLAEWLIMAQKGELIAGAFVMVTSDLAPINGWTGALTKDFAVDNAIGAGILLLAHRWSTPSCNHD